MEYVTLGPTGMEVSRLCFGTWRFGHEQAHETELDLLSSCTTISLLSGT